MKPPGRLSLPARSPLSRPEGLLDCIGFHASTDLVALLARGRRFAGALGAAALAALVLLAVVRFTVRRLATLGAFLAAGLRAVLVAVFLAVFLTLFLAVFLPAFLAVFRAAIFLSPRLIGR